MPDYKFITPIIFSIVFTSLPALGASIVNGGFEAPPVSPGTIQTFSGGANISGWRVLGNDVILVETTYGEIANGVSQFTAQEGLVSLDITGLGNTGTNNGIEQLINTIVGETYRLSFFVGRAGGNSVYSTASTVDVSIDNGLRNSFTNANLTPGAVNWQNFSLDFIATNTSTKITFFNGTSDNNFVGLDNVQIAQVIPIPEPNLSLGIVTFFGLGAICQYRKR